MPFTIRLSTSRIALFAAIAILPVSAEVLAEPGVAMPVVVATIDAAAVNAVVNEAPAPVLADVADTGTVATTADIATADIECIAKVVHHEAGNQPHTGKVAVAQVIVNRANRVVSPAGSATLPTSPGSSSSFLPIIRSATPRCGVPPSMPPVPRSAARVMT